MENVSLPINRIAGQDILSRIKISNSFQDISEKWGQALFTPG
jgi:hypothetical protein